MRIIIDGYNLFKSVVGNCHISKKEHVRLMNQLIAYAHKKKHNIIIFFDSGPSFFKEILVSSEHLKVCYAGQGISADQRIIEYANTCKNRPLLMVSNDNELKRSVSLQGVDSIKSLEFWYFIEQSSQSPKLKTTCLNKYSKDINIQLDDLMQATCVSQVDTPDEKFDGAGLSKKEKKIALLRRKL